MVGIS
ncbi:hypothetical protein F383_28427 [Gossypium arboreum]